MYINLYMYAHLYMHVYIYIYTPCLDYVTKIEAEKIHVVNFDSESS